MTQKEENAALNDILRNNTVTYHKSSAKDTGCPDICDRVEIRDQYGKMSQWTTGDNKCFFAAGYTTDFLPPGVYEINQSPQSGLYFEKIPVRTEGLIRFPQTNSERVIKEIDTFWNREQVFKEYGLTYKRGIILWGPPGAGKTCTVNLLMQDVVSRAGLVIKFTSPHLFLQGMRVLREVQPTTPIVVLMEDIDAIIHHYEESPVLNILDGVESVQKVVFLATTNYPELLGPRIINRPSRFDKRFHIGHPNAESRKLYLNHLSAGKALKIDLDKWVRGTDGFSIAHLKELFVAVVIIGDDYEEALENLTLMREDISSDKDSGKNFNLFGRRKDEEY